MVFGADLSFQLLAQNLFNRTRLAGQLAEAQKKGISDPATAHGEKRNGVPLGRGLEHDGVELVHLAGQFPQAAEDFGHFLKLSVQGCGALEMESFARDFAFVLEFARERSTARAEKVQQAADLDVILRLAATGKAWRQAHFYLRINAAGKVRVPADFDQAATKFEEIKEIVRERFRSLARREGAEVEAAVG